MEEEKKMYAWLPSNCERFYEVYDSIEEAVAEAQNQWNEKYEYYEEEGENNTEIYLMVVDQFNIEKSMGCYGEILLEYLDEQLFDFTSFEDSKVSCKCKELFNQKVKEALIPIIKECLSFDTDQVGNILTLTYNVDTRKYNWNGEEHDAVPEAFRKKEG